MCDTPFYVHVKWQPEKVPVPCGRCPPCQSRRVSQWSFRLRKQSDVSTTSLFLTLTYDTAYVPITKRGFMSLQKSDFQKFMKRLRKISDKDEKISYYACGEYGSRNYRPHYHAIIFNARKEQIQKAWQLGDIHIGNVSGASIAYTLKYINKGKIIPMHAKDDRVPEFSLMSKGMGKSYLSDQVIATHKKDLARAYVVIEGGIKIALPRYYKEKIYTEDERKKQALICGAVAREADGRNRAEYIAVTGSISGYEEQVESGQISRYNRHRKLGLQNRKI